jgi:CrcB protein
VATGGGCGGSRTLLAVVTPDRRLLRVIGVISLGGVAGALSRYALSVAFPTATGAFPWTIFAVNVSGCFAIGVLIVAVEDVWPAKPLLRPFLGTGFLGGYTTFSTYVVDAVHLDSAGKVGAALAYLGGTLVAALTAVYVGMVATRTSIEALRRRR